MSQRNRHKSQIWQRGMRGIVATVLITSFLLVSVLEKNMTTTTSPAPQVATGSGEFNAPYNFVNDVIGQAPAGFEVHEGVGETYSVIESYEAASAYGGITNHNTVLRLQHTKYMQKGYAQHTFTSPATGNDQICEFWMCNPGPFSYNNLQGFAFFRNDANTVAGISFDAGKIEVIQRSGFTLVGSYVMNSWMHIRFEFDISSEQFTVSVNEAVLGTYTLGVTSEITNIQFWTEQWYNNPNDGTYNIYVDAMGYNWAGTYHTGDNLHLIVRESQWHQEDFDAGIPACWIIDDDPVNDLSFCTAPEEHGFSLRVADGQPGLRVIGYTNFDVGFPAGRLEFDLCMAETDSGSLDKDYLVLLQTSGGTTTIVSLLFKYSLGASSFTAAIGNTFGTSTYTLGVSHHVHLEFKQTTMTLSVDGTPVPLLIDVNYNGGLVQRLSVETTIASYGGECRFDNFLVLENTLLESNDLPKSTHPADRIYVANIDNDPSIAWIISDQQGIKPPPASRWQVTQDNNVVISDVFTSPGGQSVGYLTSGLESRSTPYVYNLYVDDGYTGWLLLDTIRVTVVEANWQRDPDSHIDSWIHPGSTFFDVADGIINFDNLLFGSVEQNARIENQRGQTTEGEQSIILDCNMIIDPDNDYQRPDGSGGSVPASYWIWDAFIFVEVQRPKDRWTPGSNYWLPSGNVQHNDNLKATHQDLEEGTPNPNQWWYLMGNILKDAVGYFSPWGPLVQFAIGLPLNYAQISSGPDPAPASFHSDSPFSYNIIEGTEVYQHQGIAWHFNHGETSEAPIPARNHVGLNVAFQPEFPGGEYGPYTFNVTYEIHLATYNTASTPDFVHWNYHGISPDPVPSYRQTRIFTIDYQPEVAVFSTDKYDIHANDIGITPATYEIATQQGGDIDLTISNQGNVVYTVDMSIPETVTVGSKSLSYHGRDIGSIPIKIMPGESEKVKFDVDFYRSQELQENIIHPTATFAYAGISASQTMRLYVYDDDPSAPTITSITYQYGLFNWWTDVFVHIHDESGIYAGSAWVQWVIGSSVSGLNLYSGTVYDGTWISTAVGAPHSLRYVEAWDNDVDRGLGDRSILTWGTYDP